MSAPHAPASCTVADCFICDADTGDAHTESFELFKLRGLLARLEGEDAEIVREAIWRMADLEHQVARDDELWRGLTIRATEPRGEA